MGYVREGIAISYSDAKQKGFVDLIRALGVRQFLSLFQRSKDRRSDTFKWGDEIEYQLVHLDPSKKRAHVAIVGPTVLARLQERERRLGTATPFHFQPEYASFQVEGTPGSPYCSEGERESFLDLLKVETNMRERRHAIQAELPDGVHVVTLTCFPRLGLGDYIFPAPNHETICNDGIPDELVAPHPRYRSLTQNILQRRGDGVNIRTLVYPDRLTTIDAIEMKAVAYGTAMCCLQTTFQCPDLEDARWLYDQLAALAPLLLALTAATPIAKGVLVATDARWQIISASSDDRTPTERMVGSTICKSRFDTISVYVSRPESDRDYERLNDLPVAVEPSAYSLLLSSGVDSALARHVAHLFSREPLIIIPESIHPLEGGGGGEGSAELEARTTIEGVPANDATPRTREADTDTEAEAEACGHFDNIQSTNWHSVRLKPPTVCGGCGWRVELRTMEVQLTDEENAAFAVFSALLAKALLDARKHSHIDWRLPLSLVDLNMVRAHTINALATEKFYFRDCKADDASVRELTADEIVNAHLVPFLRGFMGESSAGVGACERRQLDLYISMIERRARGELVTDATWIRRFVCAHPCYGQNSVVTEEITYDLLNEVAKLSKGELRPVELLGEQLAAHPRETQR